MARIEELREKYAGSAEFVFIYIKEAHPDDEWQSQSNVEKDLVFKQPRTLEERIRLAQTFVSEMDVETPTLVDDITNTANACYAAWPERIYVVDTSGKIVYKGGMGPFFFDPEELDRFLADFLPDTRKVGRSSRILPAAWPFAAFKQPRLSLGLSCP